MSSISDFTYKTAAELQRALSVGDVLSVELTKAAIDRIEHLDGDINAVCVRDFDRALIAAQAADASRRRGEVRPLLGIPITVKESFNIAGLATTWGMPPFKDYVATQDAVAVARMKEAGAVVLGKTNVPFALGDLQTYNDIYGTTRNPWNLDRTPGGSSGGSAAALAAGYGALSLGSDIAGSLRFPAHYCGIYAHKPTHGLLPSRGHTPPLTQPLPYERDLTVIGPMARSAFDLSLAVEILAAPDENVRGIAYRVALPPARHDKLADFRILIIDAHPMMPTESSIGAALGTLADRLGKAGAVIENGASVLPDLEEDARLYMRLLMSSLSASLPAAVYERICERAAAVDANDFSLAAERTRGSALSHRNWLLADAARAQLLDRWRMLFQNYDVVLCPAAPTTAFAHNHAPDQWTRKILIDGAAHNYGDQLVWAGIATTPGLPATVAPIGHSKEGLPIGVQIIGPLFEDRTTLRFAELLEEAFGGFVPPPAN